MLRGVKVEAFPAAVADHEEAVQHPERHRRHREEVHGRNHFLIVLQEDQPAFACISLTAHSSKVSRDGALGNLKAELY